MQDKKEKKKTEKGPIQNVMNEIPHNKHICLFPYCTMTTTSSKSRSQCLYKTFMSCSYEDVVIVQ